MKIGIIEGIIFIEAIYCKVKLIRLVISRGVKKIKNRKALFWGIPSLLGVIIIYLVPLFFSLEVVIDSEDSVLTIYRKLIGNSAFILGIKNSILFLFFGILFSALLGLILSNTIKELKRHKEIILTILMLPSIIPSATVSYIFKLLFDNNGYINRITYSLNFDIHNFLNSKLSLIVVLIIFLWRNIGYATLIIYSGLIAIPEEYFDFGNLEGITLFKTYTNIIIPNITSSLAILFIVTIINSFRIFRDILLLFGEYPNKNIYMLQHFLQNQFKASNFLKLSTASHGFIMVLILFYVIFLIINKIYKEVTK